MGAPGDPERASSSTGLQKRSVFERLGAVSTPEFGAGASGAGVEESGGRGTGLLSGRRRGGVAGGKGGGYSVRQTRRRLLPGSPEVVHGSPYGPHAPSPLGPASSPAPRAPGSAPEASARRTWVGTPSERQSKGSVHESRVIQGGGGSVEALDLLSARELVEELRHDNAELEDLRDQAAEACKEAERKVCQLSGELAARERELAELREESTRMQGKLREWEAAAASACASDGGAVVQSAGEWEEGEVGAPDVPQPTVIQELKSQLTEMKAKWEQEQCRSRSAATALRRVLLELESKDVEFSSKEEGEALDHQGSESLMPPTFIDFLGTHKAVVD